MADGRIRQRPEHVINGQVCRPRRVGNIITGRSPSVARQNHCRTFSVGRPASSSPDLWQHHCRTWGAGIFSLP